MPTFFIIVRRKSDYKTIRYAYGAK